MAKILLSSFSCHDGYVPGSASFIEILGYGGSYTPKLVNRRVVIVGSHIKKRFFIETYKNEQIQQNRIQNYTNFVEIYAKFHINWRNFYHA